MGFFGFFAKKKVEGAVEDFTQLLVKFDPETATEAQIEQLEAHLTKVSEEAATARAEYQKEKKEADEIEELYNQRLAAAEVLQEKVDSAEDQATKEELENSLSELLTTLEEMQPEIEREKQEAVDAKQILDDLESMTKEAASQLKTARATLEKAQREIKRAGLREERAKRKEEQTKKMAGLKQSGSDFNTALDAMKKTADKANTSADAAEMRSKLLKPEEKKSDQHIEEALAEAKGESETPASAKDRLAALKRK